MRRAGQACLLVSTCGLFAGSLGCTRDEKPERSTFYERQIAIQTCRELLGIDRLIDALEVAEGN